MRDNDIESGVVFPAQHKAFRVDGDLKFILTTPFEQLHEAWPGVFKKPIYRESPEPPIDSFEASVREKYPDVTPRPEKKKKQ